MRRGEVTVAGVTSPTIESGDPGAREAAVFVHGNPGPGSDWELLVERTGVHGRAVALDMPGFGGAGKPEHFPYTVEGYATHLQHALWTLGIDRAHLVLHDFGGPWGLQWAAEHPEALASIVLVNTGVLLDYRWHALARIWRTPVLGELFMRTTTRRGLEAVLRRGQTVPIADDKVDAMLRSSRDPGTRRAVLSLYRSTPAGKMGAQHRSLRDLDVPTLVVWGADDPYIDVEQAERQRETFRSARVVHLDGVGHWPMYDDPGRLADTVVPFLAEHLAAAPQRMS